MSVSPRALSWQVNELTLHGLAWGEATGKPLLALHGWLDNAASFAVMAPLLAGYQVVAIDLTGHGRSDHRSADSGYQIWEDLPEIVGILEQLGWQTFDLVGHSRGAVISSLLAAAMPERIQRLVLLDAIGAPPVAESEFPAQLRRHLDDKQRLLSRDNRVFASAADAIAVRERRGLSNAAAQLLAERNLEPCEGGYTWSTDPRLTGASSVKLTTGHVHAVWQAITAPALLLLAEKGNLPGLAEYGRTAQQHMPDLTIETLAGSHHFHMEDTAPVVAGRVLEFLQES